MSDRWAGPVEYNVRLGERVSALEAHLPAIRGEIKAAREEQAANRTFTEKRFADMQKELEDVKSLVKAQPQASNERVYSAILIVGAIVTIFLVLFIIFWLSGGHIT